MENTGGFANTISVEYPKSLGNLWTFSFEK